MQDNQSGSSSYEPSYAGYLRLGFATILLLILGAGGWSAWASISGAVIAPGVIAVEGKPKTIQHIDGGLVGEILVRDGDNVEAGDVLITLDPTIIQANLAIVESKWHEALATKSRLEAELTGRDMPLLPSDLFFRLDQPAVADLVSGQRMLFESRLASRSVNLKRLGIRASQYGKQLDNLKSLQRANQKQTRLLDEELTSLRRLHEQGYVPASQLRSVEQNAARLEGETAENLAEISEIRGALDEAEAQVFQQKRDFEQEVTSELRAVVATIRELREERRATLDRLKRIEIKSPVRGLVHGLRVHTIGGVITPSEPVMEIVPQDDRFVVEARVEPQHIDQLHVGQAATLRFPAFNQRTTPELIGTIINVSADLLEDATTGIAYYQALVDIPPDQLDQLNGLILLPGMPVESFIKTGERSALSYLVKPLTDQLARAFRED